MGRFIEEDLRNAEGPWNLFLRARVSLNVEKPLLQKIKIKNLERGIDLDPLQVRKTPDLLP